MPRVSSPHDNTPDARQALRNRYQSRRASTKSSSSGSPLPGESVRRSASPRVRSAPKTAVLGKRIHIVKSLENPAPRPPHLAASTLWFGNEPDVDHTFFRWDGSLGHVPFEAIEDGIRDFEAGEHVATLSAESKAGLVHAVANEMLKKRLSAAHATLPQVHFFLVDSYRNMIARDPRLALPRGGHWILRTLRDRTEELEWIKYQAELRWWTLMEKNKKDNDRRMLEPSDSEVNALFNSYTHHSDLPTVTSWNPCHNYVS